MGMQFCYPRQRPNGEKEAGSVEETLKTIVKIIVETVDPDRIILFGSRSRKGWSDDSDYDILVIKEGVYHRRRLTQEIYRALSGVPVAIDIVLETPERLARYCDTPGLVYAEALKGRVLYER
jgi:predicted nucleotidyltransferase